MAKRKTNYTSYMRTKPPTNQGIDFQCAERAIAKIERVEEPVRTLKLTLSGGTRYSICETDERYHYNDVFDVLWGGLAKGDTVVLDCSHMKILDAYIETSEKTYEIIELSTSADKIKLHLAMKDEHLCLEFSPTDDIFLVANREFVPLKEIKHYYPVGCIVTVHWIGNRLAGFS